MIAVGRDERALTVELEGTVARVSEVAVRQGDAEEPVALNADIGRNVGGLERTLREDAVCCGDAHAQTDLLALRIRRALRARVAAGVAERLIQQILEFRADLFIAVSVDVGQVMRHHVHIRLLRDHAGGG